MKKANNIIIILIFILAAISPLAFSNFIGGGISNTENRYLAKFPDILTSDMRLVPGFKQNIESWINDNAGGRDLALQTNAEISYKVFGVIPEKDVVGGKNDWLYLMPSYDFPQYTNTNIPDGQHLEWLRNRFTSITNSLKRANIEYMVVLWPNKETVYPENIPNSLYQVTETSALQIMDDKLSGDMNFDFSTALKPLEGKKDIQQVYYKAYDRSHWNQYGAFIGYTELMNHVKLHIPNIRILTESDFVIRKIARETKTKWGYYSKEDDLDYSLIGGYKSISDKSFFSSFDFVSKDPWKSYNNFINSDKSLPKAVIVGDSFTWMFLLPNISESFSQLVFIHYNDLDYLNEIVDIVKPDIVIGAGLTGTVETLASYEYSVPPRVDAQVISTDMPSVLQRGQKYNVKIEVKNTGNVDWRRDQSICLGIYVDGKDYGFRIELPEDVTIKPGEIYTFILADLEAPPIKISSMEYQMVQKDGTNFGNKLRVNIALN